MKQNLWLGLGLQTTVTPGDLAAAIAQFLHQHHLHPTHNNIIGLATLDRKTHHPAIAVIVAQYAWQLQAFDTATLAAVVTPNPSKIVQTRMNTPSVAEAAAIAASQGVLQLPKQIQRRSSGFITLAIAAEVGGNLEETLLNRFTESPSLETQQFESTRFC